MLKGQPPNLLSAKARAVDVTTMPVFKCTNIILSITLSLLLLGHVTVHAGNVQIQVHENGISGYARDAFLKDVLGRLSAQTGSAVYLDEALSDRRVTFEIPVPLPAEYAVRRMIHPLSNAMVYNRVAGQQQLQVAAIKVYSASDKPTRFVHVPSSHDPNMAGGAAMQAALSGSQGASGQFRRGRSLDPRKQVRRPVSFSEGVFGNSRYHIDPTTNGPDYRPTQGTLAGGYAEHRIQSRAYQQHNTQSSLQSSKQQHTANQDRYRRDRKLSIQKSISGNSN